ncbi:hypothetical protein NMY3_01146 [Candidatus Nitrosocosmicus oleophilus]|uniref:Uncharacterized protein n=1 Tax=Candidatus Nitrosocosmicus oleophilus TaxID=1353260 RepID=A0A654LYK2_9ARCH|nr:hypothetical protein NMY3_01146 [Candidatus Nitrosocosmicus oleophilus]
MSSSIRFKIFKAFVGFKSIYSVGTVTSIKFFEITEPFMTDVNYKAGPVGLVIDILRV